MRRLRSSSTALALVAFLLVIVPCQTASSNGQRREGPQNHVAAVPGTGPSDHPGRETGLLGLGQSIIDISNPYGVLCIAVRPGDEDTSSLVYCRRKLGARTGVAFATSYSPADCEDGPSDGQFRAALAAGRAEGADTYFLNLPSPGPAKSQDSVIASWGHEASVERLVYAIRDFKPDVIVTDGGRASEGPLETALRSLVLEAAAKAAEEDQFVGLKRRPWKVARVFARSDVEANSVELNLNEYDNIRGLSILSQVETARSLYGKENVADGPLLYSLLYPSEADKAPKLASFFDGLELPKELSSALKSPRVGDTPLLQALGQRDLLLDSLVGLLAFRQVLGGDKKLQAQFPDQYFRVSRFEDSIARAVANLLGLQLKLTLSDNVLVPGKNFTATLTVYNGSDNTFPVELRLPSNLSTEPDSDPDRSVLTTVERKASVTKSFTFSVPREAAYSGLVKSKSDSVSYYSSDASSLAGFDPTRDCRRFVAEARIGLTAIALPIRAAVEYTIVPPFEMSVSPSTALINDWAAARDARFTVRVVSHSPAPFNGELWVVQQALVKSDYQPTRLTFVHQDEALSVTVRLRVPLLRPPLATDILIELRQAAPAPPDPLASVKIDVKPVGLEVGRTGTIGYIPGSQDFLPSALSELGAEYRRISAMDVQVSGGDSGLSGVKTLLIGPYAYSVHPELKLLNRRLLQFVREGGVLILFPQDPDTGVEPVNGQVGIFPYPIKFSDDRISVDSPAIAQPDSDVLSAPNRIAESDLARWPSACGMFAPRQWAEQYKCILKQEGAPSSSGILLLCTYGKGTFVFAGLDWDGGLRQVTPGAYKVLANLLNIHPSEPSPPPPVTGPTAFEKRSGELEVSSNSSEQ